MKELCEIEVFYVLHQAPCVPTLHRMNLLSTEGSN